MILRTRILSTVAAATLTLSACAALAEPDVTPAQLTQKTDYTDKAGVFRPAARVIDDGETCPSIERSLESQQRLGGLRFHSRSAKMSQGAVPPPAPPPPPSMSALQTMTVTGAVANDAYADVADTERYPDATPNPVKVASREPVSTFSIDVDTASYSNVRRRLKEGVLPPKGAVRIEELINYFDYTYAAPGKSDHPFSTEVNVVPSPWAEGRELVHIGVQGRDLPKGERPAMNLTLLMDVSGSMRSPDKLPLAQKALNELIPNLRREDTVSIVVYAGAAGQVLEPTSGFEPKKIRCAMENLRAGGSTAGGAGLQLAYDLTEKTFQEDGVNRVMILTDGDFNVGITQDEKLEDFVERKRESGIYLSVMGFGQGNYNDKLMQTLSQAGNGIASYVDTVSEARKLFNDDLAGNLFPIADDVKIQVEFNPAEVAEYRLIGYETRLLNEEDFNNDAVDAGEIGAGASVTALYEITRVGSNARLVDDRRYETPATPAGKSNELAFLKLRYKEPGAKESVLVTRAITKADGHGALADAPQSTRFATAVAAFGQALRQDPYMTAGYDWASIAELADSAKGEDRFGYRAEFIDLLEASSKADAMRSGEVKPEPGVTPQPRPTPKPWWKKNQSK